VSEGRTPRVAAPLYVGLVLAWGFNYLFVRAGLSYAGPIWLAALRAGVGALGIAASLVPRSQRAHLDARGIRDGLLLGLPNTALFFGLWFVAASAVLPGETAVVIYTFPLWVALLSIPLLRQRLLPLGWAAVAAGFIGVTLVAQPWAGGKTPWLPVVELLVAALSWAFGTVLYKRRFRGKEMREANVYQLAAGSVALFVAAVIFEPRAVPGPTPPLLAIVLYLGLVGTAFGYGVWFWLLQRFPAPTVSAYVFLVPVTAILGSRLVFGEPLDSVQIGGVALVLLSLYGVARSGVEPMAPRPGDPTDRSSAPETERPGTN
jgi:drug/metabolite transporter (DMT)-like permease